MPKSNQDKERVPQRYIVRKDTVPGKQECNKEMDAEMPQLELGAQPADCPVWGTAHRTSVKNRDDSNQKHLPSQPYSRGRVRAAPMRMVIKYNTCLPLQKMYRLRQTGYTIDRKNNSTALKT